MILTGVLFQVLKTSLKLFDRTYALSESDNATTLNLTQENIPDEKQKTHSEEKWNKSKIIRADSSGQKPVRRYPVLPCCGFRWSQKLIVFYLLLIDKKSIQ